MYGRRQRSWFHRFECGCQGKVRRQQEWGRNSNRIYLVVAEKMDDYDAEAISQAMSVTVVGNLVAVLDRGELMELMNLETD